MKKHNKFISLLLVAPLFFASCTHNNGKCSCDVKVDANNDGMCDTCGKQIEGKCMHKDENHDHVCDICGEELPLILKSLGKVEAPESVLLNSELTVNDVKVEAVYDDDSKVKVTPETVSVDTSKVADSVTGTVTYQGFSATFTIKVEAPVVLVRLGDVNAPDKIEQNATLDVEDVSVVAIYSNYDYENVTPESITLDTSKIGVVTGEVTYQGLKQTFTIEVIKYVTGIADVKAPEQINHKSTLDNKDVKVTLIYSDESTEEVEADNVVLDTSKCGEVTGIARYGVYEKEFNIIVVKVETGLSDIKVPQTIKQNETLDPQTIAAKLNYSDDSSIDVVAESVSLDTSVVGLQTGIISYKGFTAQFIINVVKYATALGDIVAPEKLTQNVSLVTSQIIVDVTYSDGSVEKVNPTSVEVDSSKVGKTNATIVFDGLTKQFEIEIVEANPEKKVESLGVVVPEAESIRQNDTLSKEDVLVEVIYNDKTSEMVTPDSVTLDTSNVGMATGSVSYAGKTAQFTLTVVRYAVKLNSVNAPANIVKDGSLKLSDVIVEVIFSDGTTSTVEPDSINLDTSKSGKATGTVSYEGLTANFDITVLNTITKIEVTTAPEEIDHNSEVNVSDFKIEVTFSDSSTEANITPDSVSLDTSSCGVVTGTVTYSGISAEFSITVVKTFVEIKEAYPLVSSIKVGETLDKSDVEVIVLYSDDSTAKFTPDSISLDTSTAGTITGTAVYNGVSKSFSIIVQGETVVTLVKIDNASGPSEIGQNDTLKPSDVTVYAFYSDKTSAKVTPEGVAVDTSKVGTATVTVSYQGKETTFTIQVKAVPTVVTYLVLSSVGLYDGKAGDTFADLFLENTVAYTAVPGSLLPGADKVTQKYGSADFAGWLCYEGTGAPITYTTVPFENNKILYANFVANGHDPVNPDDPTPPGPDPVYDKETYYLDTLFTDGSGNWDQQCQVMWAYVFKGNNTNAYRMVYDTGTKWKVDIPVGIYEYIIFVRLKPEAEIFSWDDKYNQTTDLKFVSGKHTAQIDNWDGGGEGKSQVHWVS